MVKNGFTYQSCDNGTGSFSYPWYDNATGAPIFDTHRFPDVKAMTNTMHEMGLRAGWYAGNYQCRNAMGKSKVSSGQWDLAKLVAGHVKAIVDYGFDSVKLDSGFGVGGNLSLWAELLNKSGRPVMIEVRPEVSEG